MFNSGYQRIDCESDFETDVQEWSSADVKAKSTNLLKPDEEALVMLADTVSLLKNMGNKVCEELDEQNDILDQTMGKTEKLETRLDATLSSFYSYIDEKQQLSGCTLLAYWVLIMILVFLEILLLIML